MKKIMIICVIAVVLIVGIIVGGKFTSNSNSEKIEKKTEDNINSEKKEVKYEVLKAKGFQSKEEATILKAKMVNNSLYAGIMSGKLPIAELDVKEQGLSGDGKIILNSVTKDLPQAINNIAGIEEIYDFTREKDALLDPLGKASEDSKNYFRIYWEGTETTGKTYIVSSEAAAEETGEIFIYDVSSEELTPYKYQNR